MTKRFAALGCLVCIPTVGLAACGGSGSTRSDGTAIKGNSLTIYSSLPDQGASGRQAEAIENGAKLALEQAGSKVGKYKIVYKPLDDSTATGIADEGTAAENARTAVRNASTIGYIGDYNSRVSKVTIPILNKAGIAQISPSNTYVGLTTREAGAESFEPQKYYPTGKRTFARVVPKDTLQGPAVAQAAKYDGCKSVHIWNSQTMYSAGLARSVEKAAKEQGLRVEGNDGIDPKAPDYGALAAKIKSDCFIFTGETEPNGIQALKDASTAPSVEHLYGITLDDAPDPMKGLPVAVASKFRGIAPTLDSTRLGPAGKKFLAGYSAKYKTASPDPYAIYGYEAMSLMLDSINRGTDRGKKDATRQEVVDALLSTDARKSVIGTYDIDENGDTTLADYGLYKVENGKVVFDRVLKPGP